MEISTQKEIGNARIPQPSEQWFTTTHWSVVLAAGQGASPHADQAIDRLCRTYWYPLYGYARRRGYTPQDAQDFIQGFFARLLERNWLGTATPQKGKFRSFLLAALNHHISDERDRMSAQKRGGGTTLISLDQEMAENLFLQEPASVLSPEKEFEKRWATTLLQQALARVREEYQASGKAPIFDQLKPFLEGEAESGDYAEIAARLGMSPGSIAVSVHRLRQAYREAVRIEIANTVSNPDEVADEMRHLFAVLAQ
jgi:RNA polymerase sigma-70 factor (ECF subfamily)